MSLSRRSLLLAGLIILLAVIGVWSGPPIQGIWRWPAALLLLMIAWERLKFRQVVQITRTVPERARLGDQTSYQLTLDNRGRTAVALDCQAAYPPQLQGENTLQHWKIAAGQSQSGQLPFVPVALGTVQPGRLYLRILGHLGLAWWSRTYDDSSSITIEPAMLAQSPAIPGQLRSGERQAHHKPGSGFDLLAIRDYHFGDAQRSIDWKATARRNKPMVRIFSQEQHLEIAVLLDCGRASQIQCGLMDRFHHSVNIAARLADYAVRHGDRVAGVAYVDQIVHRATMAGGMAGLKKFRSFLTGLGPVTEESNPLNVALELQGMLKRRSLVVILTEMEQALAATQLIKAGQLLAVKHHVIVASIEDPAVARLQLQPGSDWLSPYRHYAALEFSRNRELARSRLRRSGISVITAEADSLDVEVLRYYRTLRERIDV